MFGSVTPLGAVAFVAARLMLALWLMQNCQTSQLAGLDRVAPYQNVYFNANWIKRGFTLVLVICPNVPAVIEVTALLNCA